MTGIAGVLGLQSQIEGLAQVLGEEPEAVSALQTRGGVVVLECPLARRLQSVTEPYPRGIQLRVVSAVSKSHRRSPMPQVF